MNFYLTHSAFDAVEDAQAVSAVINNHVLSVFSAKTCEPIDLPTYGVTNTSSARFNSVVAVTCDIGYRFVDNATTDILATCVNGAWHFDPPLQACLGRKKLQIRTVRDNTLQILTVRVGCISVCR
jgi:hypothetical protein